MPCLFCMCYQKKNRPAGMMLSECGNGDSKEFKTMFLCFFLMIVTLIIIAQNAEGS